MTNNYRNSILDLGTGDGRFVYENAIRNPENFYIGVDPSIKQLEIYQRKINRRKVSNAELFVGSLQNLPTFKTKFDEIYITLPWGTLLESVVRPTKELAIKMRKLLNTAGKLQIIFGYHQDIEPAETQRLKLPNLTKDYIEKNIISVFEKGGFELIRLEKLQKEDLRRLSSSWAKKLAFGNPRDFWLLEFKSCMLS